VVIVAKLDRLGRSTRELLNLLHQIDEAGAAFKSLGDPLFDTTVLVGDVETTAGAKDVASQANALGRFDAVIHNAAVGYREGHRVTSDGLPHVFAINTLSAYT
jgi:NAD(P)-dependent dehydrogenase (short-subunit alcohol dehydrogenase family)